MLSELTNNLAKLTDIGKDTTLSERTKILFKEQDITIYNILTVVGKIVGFNVEAIISSTEGSSSPKPSPEPSGRVKKWTKSK